MKSRNDNLKTEKKSLFVQCSQDECALNHEGLCCPEILNELDPDEIEIDPDIECPRSTEEW